VVTPLLHAEEHRGEALEAETDGAAVADAWRAGSSDPLERLAYALEHAHESRPPGSREHQSQGHSHGPASQGHHGAGALAHFGIALHAAPQLPELSAACPEHAPPRTIAGQIHGTLRYLVPEWSQGPPRIC